MKNKALKTIKKYNMLSEGDSVVVGLSGGADSCALLHFLCTLRDEMRLGVYACHVNHLIRGDEADRDEDFVRELCDRLSVQLFVRRVCVEKLAQEMKIGCEECGREVRYRFFEETAQKYNAKIATAHTASDNAETILLHMTRGCGIHGLCGIPPVRDRIIRPLLEATREDIEAYCIKNRIDYVTDSTNLTREYSRNRIRLDVLPVLKQINPAVVSTLVRMSNTVRDTDMYLNYEAEGLLESSLTRYGYSAEKLLKANHAVYSRAVEILCRRYVPSGAEARHIDAICEMLSCGGAVKLNKSVRIIVKQGILRVEIASENVSIKPQIVLQELNDVQDIIIGNKKIKLSVLNIDEFHEQKKINKLVFNNVLDYDKIPFTKVFRTRRTGDTFVTSWGGQTKTLKKLMCELKIPSEQRNDILILASENEILWIDGIGVSNQVKVTDSTKKVLVIQTLKIL